MLYGMLAMSSPSFVHGRSVSIKRRLQKKGKAGKNEKNDKSDKKGDPTPTPAPVPQPTPQPVPQPVPPPVSAPSFNIPEIDKTILTCSVKSQPTFCQAPEATFNCFELTNQMNQCTALANSFPADEFVVFDPFNCGDGIEILDNCNEGGIQFCRKCGNKAGLDPCATGFYKDYYEPFNGQPKANANQRKGEQTIANMLGIPVRVDCDKYYATLNRFQLESLAFKDFGVCFLDSKSFEIGFFTQNFGGGATEGIPITECPPQFSGDFPAYGNNARYQLSQTTNNIGETFPKKIIPGLEVGRVPALLPVNEFAEKCEGLALGQEVNIFDAGEISVFTLTAKTMAERMLRPAVYGGASIMNCVDIVGDTKNFERCGDFSADTIDNPVTYTNTSAEPKNGVGGFFPGIYEQQVPSAARIYEGSAKTSNGGRVAKQMHGKGQTCIHATLSLEPLKENYANVQQGQFGFIPEERRVGFLHPSLVNNDVKFDTLVRFAGNKNITDVKDVHDVRIRGLGVKIFGVDEVFDQFGLAYNQNWLPFVPPFDQPENAQIALGNYNFVPEQGVGTADFTFVAVGTGQKLGLPDGQALDGVFFDSRTEEGAKNPPDNVFVASNADNYYNGFILGGDADVADDSITDVYQNPLEYLYGTAAPFRCGPAASMKLTFAACPGELSKIQNFYPDLTTAFKDPNFFYTNLKNTLQKLGDIGETEFKMCGYAQFQENPCTEPLENPTVRWLTENIKIFELSFSSQFVPEYNSFCDNTVITPWRMIQEHQPQSFIQRVRAVVYIYAWQFRLILNNGVQKTKSSTGQVADTLFENTCPYGFDDNRFEPLPLDKRQPGKVYSSFSSVLEVNPATGVVPDPTPASSSGECTLDDECELPFGKGSVCNGSGQCDPTNDGLFPFSST